MTIQQMREQRAARAKELRALVDDHTGDKWTVQCQERYDALVREIEDLDARIERAQKALDLEARTNAEIQRLAAERGISEDYAHAVKDAERGMLAAWIRGGRQALTEEQNRLLNSRFVEIRNTMSTGVGSEGGFTVQKEVARQIVEAMAAYGGMRRVATIITTESGAELQYPTSDGTSEEGELVPENVAATAADPTFGQVNLNTYKFSSKIIPVPIELIQDSAVDIEAFVRRRIEQRLGRITNRLFTTGTGTSEPRGIVTAASAGKVGTTGQTTTVTYDDLVDLEHSVDPAYRELGNARWMMHDQTLKAIKKLKDAQNRPLWLPGIATGDPDTILGYPYVINQHMPQMGANAKSILFGDFSFYVIRDVMAILLLRFADSKYMEKGQVGFLAWMRSGGNFTDVGGAVKYYQNSAT